MSLSGKIAVAIFVVVFLVASFWGFRIYQSSSKRIEILSQTPDFEVAVIDQKAFLSYLNKYGIILKRGSYLSLPGNRSALNNKNVIKRIKVFVVDQKPDYGEIYSSSETPTLISSYYPTFGDKELRINFYLNKDYFVDLAVEEASKDFENVLLQSLYVITHPVGKFTKEEVIKTRKDIYSDTVRNEQVFLNLKVK